MIRIQIICILCPHIVPLYHSFSTGLIHCCQCSVELPIVMDYLETWSSGQCISPETVCGGVNVGSTLFPLSIQKICQSDNLLHTQKNFKSCCIIQKKSNQVSLFSMNRKLKYLTFVCFTHLFEMFFIYFLFFILYCHLKSI